MRRRTFVLLIVLVILGVGIVAFYRERASAHPAATLSGLDVSRSAPCAVAPPAGLPSGWHADVDKADCVSFGLPADLPAPPADAPASTQMLDTGDLSSYVAFDVRDAAPDGGCHAKPKAYGNGCINASTVKAEYARVDAARAGAYLGPAVRTRCDVGVDCVVREAHVFTSDGRWLVATIYVAAVRYDAGFDRTFIDIVRTIDAR